MDKKWALEAKLQAAKDQQMFSMKLIIKIKISTSIYPENKKTLSQKDICTPVFTAVLRTIARI